MLRTYYIHNLAPAFCLLACASHAGAQSAQSRALITQPVDEARLLKLNGNTRPEAVRQNDLGPVEDDLHLDMYLQLKRSPERELAASQFVESLTDSRSPNFHKWITAAEYGRRFGAAPEDIAAVSRWLESRGFTINGVPAHDMVIDFSGTAGLVRRALHTEIHYLNSAAGRRFANMSDPSIPAALAPAVAGVVSLNDFSPHPMLVPRSQYTVTSTSIPLVPGDLATIYNLTPAFTAGFAGQGQTIVVLEDTDLYGNSADWKTFRKTFGLDQYSGGSLTQVHPAPGKGGACVDPGVNGDDAEAAIDAQWASAAAPSAAIVLASCQSTTNFGGFVALQNMLTNGAPLPSVVSISYGESETAVGAAENTYIATLYQTAAAAGVSVFVSSGDSNAAGNDRSENVAIHGINVSGFASTPYNVAVGGTDFGDFAAGISGSFWNSSNGLYYDSAKSYVPEIPWNDSCGSQVLTTYRGFTAAYGASAICNLLYEWLDTDGGSGGPSGCATGVPAINGVVSGSCAGYPKPSWQSISGNPGDGVRDLPDVSLFASAGMWGHYYVFCLSDGAGCTGAPSNWYGAGGTSFSSPILAGIQALINQALGENNVGNPNPVYYAIAQNQYASAATAAACNSTSGPVSSCSFNDVTQGDIVVPCAGAFNCYAPSGGLGILSVSSSSDQPAFAAGPGWDFATGLGTVNAFNLLNAFVNSAASSSVPAAPALAAPANAATDVTPDAVLTWSASPGATSYDIYFGTAASPPMVANTGDVSYNPGPISAGTTYYWAVGARNSQGATVSQPWSFTTACSSALSPSSATVTAGGGPASIPVTAPGSCAWTAASSVSWITISAGASGSGNGTVSYAVAPDTGSERIGSIAVAGQTFTVTQGGAYPLISTLAGNAMPATPAPGSSISVPLAYGVAVDASGNVYFASPTINAVFKADTNGVVTRVAGSGAAGRSGDGGPALLAELNNPNGVAVDTAGNVYIADSNNRVVRKVDASGNISTVAGDGFCCTASGDGGPAPGADIGTPYGLAIDSSGNLYISDVSNSVVRQVSASGAITTVAGAGSSGYSGDGGPANAAKLNGPYGIALDGSGNLYIADRYNYRVRMVSAGGTITTIAGSGKCCYGGDGGPASSALLDYPTGVTVDGSGNVFIADSNNQRVRKVDSSGNISTVAGVGTAGFSGDGAPAAAARLNSPYGVAVDSSGNLYISDSANSRLRQVNSGGTISTYAGGAVNDGGLSVFGLLGQPSGILRDSSGNTYIADTSNNRVRIVAPNGAISTFAGTGVAGFSGDGGPAAAAQLSAPAGLALDGSGNLYIADSGNLRIRMVSSGTISTIAGNGKCCYSGDAGDPLNAELNNPTAVAVDSSGNVYIADSNNERVRMVGGGVITTVAGTGSFGYSGDGGPAASAKLYNPSGLAIDSAGNLYIADRFNYRIRMVNPAGVISTVAGSGSCCYGGDGGSATKALLDEPAGVAVDANGNLFIADTYNERIREVSNGTITTVAGSGSYGYWGDGGLATGAAFRYPYAISVDANGNLAVTDQNNNAVRLLTPAYSTPVLAIVSEHSGAFNASQNAATYTLTVSNGAQAAPTSGPVTVTEIAPAGLAVTVLSGTGWNCSLPAATCTRSDVLGSGESFPPITATVNVSGSAPNQVMNQASVSGGGGLAARAQDLTMITSSATADVRKRR